MLTRLLAAFKAAKTKPCNTRAANTEPSGGDAAQQQYTQGLVHLRDGRVEHARASFATAHQMLPTAAPPLGMLGFCGWFDGETQAARADYDRAIGLATPAERGVLRINRLIDTLPQIAESGAQLQAERAWFERELDALLADPPSIAGPLQEIHRTVFYLGYQGLNDCAANRKLAQLFAACTPSLNYVAAHVRAVPQPGVRLQVGFVSMNLHKHSVGAWYNQLLRGVLDAQRFDCILFTYLDTVDETLRQAAETQGQHVFLERTLEGARAQLEAARLDVLIYTDVGMHPFPYFLAFSRLARVQALLVGHPGTSGVPALDWFISNVHQDTADAQAHYSEQLVRLPQIPVWVKKTAPPAVRMSRAALGWEAPDTDTQAHYYVCPMMLQKMHPDFDWALAEILRRDAHAAVVLFADREHPLWQEQLEQRFRAALPDVAARIVFRSFAPKQEFLSLLLEADCVLDPFHFSGGVTTYVALSLGVPVITLPGAWFRSRMTAGIYAQAGIDSCIARSPEHYVELALRCAADPAWRAAQGARIVAAHAKLFETDNAIDGFADWVSTVAAAPDGTITA